MGLARTGDHIVVVRTIYRNTYRILNEIAPRYGIRVTFVGGHRVEDFEAALRPETSLFFLESPASSRYSLQDLAAVAELAKSRGSSRSLIIPSPRRATRTRAISALTWLFTPAAST